MNFNCETFNSNRGSLEDLTIISRLLHKSHTGVTCEFSSPLFYTRKLVNKVATRKYAKSGNSGKPGAVFWHKNANIRRTFGMVFAMASFINSVVAFQFVKRGQFPFILTNWHDKQFSSEWRYLLRPPKDPSNAWVE